MPVTSEMKTRHFDFAEPRGNSGNVEFVDFDPIGSTALNPVEQDVLQRALRYQDLKTAEVTAASLLSNSTNPNPPTLGHDSPLHIAASRRSYELVEMLIRLGAKINQANRNGKTAAQVAEQTGHEAVFKLISNHESVSRTCQTSRTAYDVDGEKYNAPEIGSIPLFKRREMDGRESGERFMAENGNNFLRKAPRHPVTWWNRRCF